MDFTTWTIAQLLARRAAIGTEVDGEGADLDALEEELRAINEEIERRRAAEETRNRIRSQVAAGAGTNPQSVPESTPETRSLEEIRSSQEYIDAFANYIRTNDDSECRALLTTNSNVSGNPGQVPVPTVIEGRIRTAWERTGLLDLVRRTYVRGNLSVGFELSATGAAVHAEGTDAPAEETLTLGVVTMVPQSIKKWIRISDEAIDMGGEEFLDYIYDEITYQIAKEAKRQLILKITSAGPTNTATAIGVPVINEAPGLATVAKAVAQLSDDADDVTVVMNRQTHADFIALIAANSYLFDPFENTRVVYDNTLPAYAASLTQAQTWMIVGDFSGAHMNFPNGEDIRVKYDDLTEAQADLVKLVGRMFVAIGITAPGHFVKVNGAGE